MSRGDIHPDHEATLQIRAERYLFIPLDGWARPNTTAGTPI
jgi:hypothetical protein